MPLPYEAAINTARQTFLQTLGSPCNNVVSTPTCCTSMFMAPSRLPTRPWSLGPMPPVVLPSLFDATNWSDPGSGHNILIQLNHNDLSLYNQSVLRTASQTPAPACHNACLPFINDYCLVLRLRTVSPTLPKPKNHPQQASPPAGTTTHKLAVHNLLIAGLQQPWPGGNPSNWPAPSCGAHNWTLLLTLERTNSITGKHTIIPATLSLLPEASSAIHVSMQNTDILNSSPSIFNFLCTPYSKKTSFNTPTLPSHTTTTLLINDSQMAYSNNLIAGHNFLLIFWTLSCDTEHILLYKFLFSLLQLFDSPCVHTWIDQSLPFHPFIWHCLLCVLNEAILPFIILVHSPNFLHHVVNDVLLTLIGFQTANSAFPNLTCMVEQIAYTSDHLNLFKSAPCSFLCILSDNGNLKHQCCQPPQPKTSATSASDTTTTQNTTTIHGTSHNLARHQGFFVLKSGTDPPCLDGPLDPARLDCASTIASFTNSSTPPLGPNFPTPTFAYVIENHPEETSNIQ
eukprot:jgi/Psemu1/14774/gm1.14774_g